MGKSIKQLRMHTDWQRVDANGNPVMPRRQGRHVDRYPLVEPYDPGGNGFHYTDSTYVRPCAYNSNTLWIVS